MLIMAEDELVDVVDKYGIPISTKSRKEARAKNLLSRSTIILVFNRKNEIFISKRSKKKSTTPGLYEIGQGGVLLSGETYEQNAKRELLEELGIVANLTYLFDFHFIAQKNSYLAKVFMCKYDGEIGIQKEEIEDGFFISLEKLKEMLGRNPDQFTPDSPEILKKYLESLV